MSHETARKTIIAAWKAVWDASDQADLPMEFQNQPFQRPKNKTWGRLTLLPGDTEPAALGDQMERTPFALIVQIFLPENSGTKAAFQAAAAMSGLDYQAPRSADRKVAVNFRTAGLAAAGLSDGFDSFNVTVRGHYDIHRSSL